MNELEENHSKFLEKKDEIDQFSLSMKQKNEEIHNLQAQIAELQTAISEINGNLGNSNMDMAKGVLSTEEFLGLKKQLHEKETLISSLREVIQAQNHANEILKQQRTEASRGVRIIKEKMASDLSTQAVNKIATVAGVELKELIYALLSTASLNANTNQVAETLYRDIGEKICGAVFNDKDNTASLLPGIFKARDEFDLLLTKL